MLDQKPHAAGKASGKRSNGKGADDAQAAPAQPLYAPEAVDMPGCGSAWKNPSMRICL